MIKMENSLLRQIGNHIRFYLWHNNLTQEELAKLSGMPLGTLSRIINGRTNPTIKTLEKIANALGVTVKDLFD